MITNSQEIGLLYEENRKLNNMIKLLYKAAKDNVVLEDRQQVMDEVASK